MIHMYRLGEWQHCPWSQEDEQESSQESKPSWTAPNSPQPGRSDRIRPCGPGTGHGQAPAVQPLFTPSSQAQKKTLHVNPHFFPVNDWGLKLQTNSTQIQPELFFFFGHESGKNVNLLRSWLVSFCDNCLSSLKPPTRCTSSLTEME